MGGIVTHKQDAAGTSPACNEYLGGAGKEVRAASRAECLGGHRTRVPGTEDINPPSVLLLSGKETRLALVLYEHRAYLTYS